MMHSRMRRSHLETRRIISLNAMELLIASIPPEPTTGVTLRMASSDGSSVLEREIYGRSAFAGQGLPFKGQAAFVEASLGPHGYDGLIDSGAVSGAQVSASAEDLWDDWVRHANTEREALREAELEIRKHLACDPKILEGLYFARRRVTAMSYCFLQWLSSIHYQAHTQVEIASHQALDCLELLIVQWEREKPEVPA
jgi:hypothetical protein